MLFSQLRIWQTGNLLKYDSVIFIWFRRPRDGFDRLLVGCRDEEKSIGWSMSLHLSIYQWNHLFGFPISLFVAVLHDNYSARNNKSKSLLVLQKSLFTISIFCQNFARLSNGVEFFWLSIAEVSLTSTTADRSVLLCLVAGGVWIASSQWSKFTCQLNSNDIF